MIEVVRTTGHRAPNVSVASPTIVGESAALRRLMIEVESVAPFACTVLIRGESGTGKELIAQTIHQRSPRATSPFVAVDCTTLRDSLLESQLFGHVKGAFTGADRENVGFIRAADSGTLFLDEIGELPLVAQAKLLRCIQERSVVPVGGTRPVPVNIRVLAATHRDLRQMVKEGTFREDLYFRLHVVQITAPPLRERGSDTLVLAQHFLDQLAHLYAGPKCTLSPDACAVINTHTWPGNVRELANAMEHAFIFRGDRREIDAECLPEDIRRSGSRERHEVPDTSSTHTPPSGWPTPQTAAPIESPPRPLILTPQPAPAGSFSQAVPPDEPVTWAEMEQRMIRAALARENGNISAAARSLAIERRRLTRKIDEYGLRMMTVG